MNFLSGIAVTPKSLRMRLLCNFKGFRSLCRQKTNVLLDLSSKNTGTETLQKSQRDHYSTSTQEIIMTQHQTAKIKTILYTLRGVRVRPTGIQFAP